MSGVSASRQIAITGSSIKKYTVDVVNSTMLSSRALIIHATLWRTISRSPERRVIISLNTAAQENIAGNRVVRAFAREDYEIDRFSEKNKEYSEANKNFGHFLCVASVYDERTGIIDLNYL